MTTARRPLLIPRPIRAESTFVGDLLRQETVGGAVVLIAAVAAVVWANSPWSDSYQAFRHLQVGPLDLEQWAADGALAVFFFVAGLELKREFLVGSLRRPADAAVPIVAALAGVATPALVYTVVNLVGGGDTGGWAIPAATDIAFALAVLSVVGSSLPSSLRAFLLTLAVVDDLVVIIIIAVFYTSTLHLLPLLLAARPARDVRLPPAPPGDHVRGLRAAGRRRPGGACTRAASTRRSPGSPSGCSPGCCPTRTRSTPRPSGSSTGSPRCPPASPCRSSPCCRPAW